MKLECQVVALDLAKKLKELGGKQESVLSWSAREGMDGRTSEDGRKMLIYLLENELVENCAD